MKALLFLLTLLIASPALAADHWQPCGAGHEAAAAVTSDRGLTLSSRLDRRAGRHKSLCFDTDGTAQSLMVRTTSCDNVDFAIFDMTDGDLTGMTAQVYACPSPGTTVVSGGGNCEPLGSALDSTNVRNMGFPANYFFIDFSGNSESEDGRVEARCNLH